MNPFLRLALVFAAVGAVLLALHRYGSRLGGARPIRLPDGRRALSPGWLIWGLLAATSGIALAGLCTLLLFGPDQARPDYSRQFNGLLAIAVGFTLASAWLLYTTVLPKVRWDDDAVEKAPVLGALRRIPWEHLDAMTVTGSEDIVLRSDSGTKIRFSSYMRGASELRALSLLQLMKRASADEMGDEGEE